MATNQAPADVNSALSDILARSQWRQTLVTDYAETATRLQQAYGRILPDLQTHAGGLVDRISQWVELNPDASLTSEYVKGFKEYQDLLARVQVEMQDFASLLKNEAGIVEGRALDAGTQSALELAQAVSGGAGQVVAAAWNQVSPEALAQTSSYVDSPAFKASIATFGENASTSIGDVIIAGIGQGKSPSSISTILSNWYAIPVSWANTTVRTVQMYSYHGGAHESYKQNSDVVSGWMWWADLFGACGACVAQHGTIHDLNESLNDHHNGECTELPIVKGTTWVNEVKSGPDWFAEQSSEYQRSILGAGKMELYTNGMLDWSLMSKPYGNDIFGDMRRESTLAEMNG